MRIATRGQLEAWDLSWTPREAGPWPLGQAGVDQALGRTRSAIGVYWIGFSPLGTHASFEPRYCGKAVRQSLFQRLGQHARHSHNPHIRSHLDSARRIDAHQLWFRFVEFATPQLAEFTEGVMISAFREDYKWNRKHEFKQQWALELQ